MTTMTAPRLVDLARNPAAPTAGVYIVKGDGVSFHKVGMTANVRRRLRSLGVGVPFALSLLGFLPNTKKREREHIERDLMEALRPWATRGEWFDIPADEEAVAARAIAHVLVSRPVWTEAELRAAEKRARENA